MNDLMMVMSKELDEAVAVLYIYIREWQATGNILCQAAFKNAVQLAFRNNDYKKGFTRERRTRLDLKRSGPSMNDPLLVPIAGADRQLLSISGALREHKDVAFEGHTITLEAFRAWFDDLMADVFQVEEQLAGGLKGRCTLNAENVYFERWADFCRCKVWVSEAFY